MLGLMQDRPLTVPTLLEGAGQRFASKTVVSREQSRRTKVSYADLVVRVRRVVTALDRLEVPGFARVATFAWNSQRHLELYLGVPSASRVLHTINHRLFPEQLRYILADAEDDVVFVDRSILSTIWPVLREATTLRHVVVMDDTGEQAGAEPWSADPRVVDYEDLLAGSEPCAHALDVADDRSAAALCYTSGTTGDPKGVLYDHRSIVLHALLLLTADGFALSRRDTVMPVVPMFHVNAWGLPYASIMCGADLSLPGPQTRPDQLARQIAEDDVTFAAAVTTVWRDVLPHLPDGPLPRLRTIVSGGGAVPLSLSRAYHDKLGVCLTNAWGMTETSPVVTVATPPDRDVTDADDRIALLGQPGPNLPLTSVRLRRGDDVLTAGAQEAGELEVSGPTIAKGYFKKGESGAFTQDGWLRTGDIGTLDADGRLAIVDRVKDLIKSGGEWISSVELENAIMAHPAVREAAVVGRPDERWSERPVAFVVTHDGQALTPQELREFLVAHVAKWWIPEEITLVESIPRTATGKISKLLLREQFLSSSGP